MVVEEIIFVIENDVDSISDVRLVLLLVLGKRVEMLLEFGGSMVDLEGIVGEKNEEVGFLVMNGFLFVIRLKRVVGWFRERREKVVVKKKSGIVWFSSE